MGEMVCALGTDKDEARQGLRNSRKSRAGSIVSATTERDSVAMKELSRKVVTTTIIEMSFEHPVPVGQIVYHDQMSFLVIKSTITPEQCTAVCLEVPDSELNSELIKLWKDIAER